MIVGNIMFRLLAEDGGGGPFDQLLVPMVAIGILFFFIMVRGGRKDREKRKAQLSALKKNDRVVTIGGIIGTIASTSQDGKEVTLKIDDNTRMKVLRSAIQGGLREEGSTASAENLKDNGNTTDSN